MVLYTFTKKIELGIKFTEEKGQKFARLMMYTLKLKSTETVHVMTQLIQYHVHAFANKQKLDKC